VSLESSILIAAGQALPVAGTSKISTCSRDIRKEPLVRRKAELKKIIAGTDLQFSESFEIDGQAMFEHACGGGLDGVVSKVRKSV
jgi:ATP-dependent DNA ligase